MAYERWELPSPFWGNAPEAYDPDIHQLNLSCSQLIYLELLADVLAIGSDHDDELTTQKSWFLKPRPGRVHTNRPPAVAKYLKLP